MRRGAKGMPPASAPPPAEKEDVSEDSRKSEQSDDDPSNESTARTPADDAELEKLAAHLLERLKQLFPSQAWLEHREDSRCTQGDGDTANL